MPEAHPKGQPITAQVTRPHPSAYSPPTLTASAQQAGRLRQKGCFPDRPVLTWVQQGVCSGPAPCHVTTELLLEGPGCPGAARTPGAAAAGSGPPLHPPVGTEPWGHACRVGVSTISLASAQVPPVSLAAYPKAVQLQEGLVVGTFGRENIHLSAKLLQLQPLLQPLLSLLPGSLQALALLAQEPQSAGHFLGVRGARGCDGLAPRCQLLHPGQYDRKRIQACPSSHQPSSPSASLATHLRAPM